MTYQTLYRKYRPQLFSDVVGQHHITRTLQNAVYHGKVAHAYLFSGPRGTGKTTTARILAKTLNCEARPRDATDAAQIEPCNECLSCRDVNRDVSFDVEEVDAASNRGIDDIRDLSDRAQRAASDPSRHRVFIIDEVHQLSRDGASAFLKTLEEPPENVIFVLATTDPDRMIGTILSRCQRFDFRPVPVTELARRLEEVCEAEGIAADTAALEAIARRARGGVRDGLSALEQANALFDGRISADDIAEIFGGIEIDDLHAAVQAIIDRDAGSALRHVDDMVDRGIDVRVFTRELADYVRAVFVVAAAPQAPELVDVTEDDYHRIRSQALEMGPALATRTLTTLGQALVQMPQSLNPRNDLDLALVGLAHPQADSSAAALAARVDALERRLNATTASRSGETGGVSPRQQSEAQVPQRAAPSRELDRKRESDKHDIGLHEIERAWPALVAGVGDRSKRARAYFQQSAPVELRDRVVSVRFPTAHSAAHATGSDIEALFGDVSESVLGVRLTIEGAVGADKSLERESPVAPEPLEPSPSAAPQSPANAAGEEDEAALGGDGGVSEAGVEGGGVRAVLDLVTSEMNAEVVEERDLP